MRYRPAAAASLLLALAPLFVAVQRTRRREPCARDRFHDSPAVLQRQIERLQAQIDHLERHRQDLEAERDEFLATLSHELRSPLNAMLGWIELLRLQIRDPAQQAHALAVIERNARAEVRIVDELLDMARLVTHRARIAREPVALDQVVTSAVDAIRTTAAAYAIAVHVDAEHAIEVMGDPVQLQRALAHLLDNAIKFSDRGGRITVTLQRDETHATIAVADTGIGIAAEMLPVVFDRFRQVEHGLTRQYGGLGLGLAIVKHTVALHDGTVEAASGGLGRGARFTIRLPLGAGP